MEKGSLVYIIVDLEEYVNILEGSGWEHMKEFC